MVLKLCVTHHSLQDDLRIRVTCRIDHARAVDQEDALHQRDVLPDLGLAGYRGHLADFLGPQRVDDGALAHVWVTDEADADLLLVDVQLCGHTPKDFKNVWYRLKSYGRREHIIPK